MLWYPWWPWCKREQLHRLDSVRPSLVFNTKLFQEHRFSETCSGTWLKFPHFAMEPMQCSIASDAKSALCGSQCDRIWKWIHQSQHDLSAASFLRFTLHCYWLVCYARVLYVLHLCFFLNPSPSHSARDDDFNIMAVQDQTPAFFEITRVASSDGRTMSNATSAWNACSM